MNQAEKTVFECVAVWEGMLYAHSAPTFEDAYQWLMAYYDQPTCKVRIWRKVL